MADLATHLLRTVSRTFYTTEHILVIDALIIHSTLPDNDLAHVLGMQVKALRKICGRLKEDGLLSVQQRQERRTDGTQSFYSGGQGQHGRERMTNKEWYYLNFHKAIDSIKYRMYHLNKRIESLGAPTMEKKDLSCPRCKSQYTNLEVVDRIDRITGDMPCLKCGHVLDHISEEDKANENESMKRLNSQTEKILRLMQRIDGATVPENDWETALSKQKPIVRTDAHPGQQRTETVDVPNRNMQSAKGMEIKPEKISVQVQDDETVKAENAAAEEAARREKEARENSLPDWIAKSTVSGDITAVGAKEERLRKEREAHSASIVTKDDGEEKKAAKDGEQEDVMEAYWEELAKAQAEEAARAKEEEEDEEDDEEDDEDEFEDMAGVGGTTMTNGTPAVASNGVPGSNTPALESSNATDDEREVKRVRLAEPPVVASPSQTANGTASAEKVAEGTPAASDEDDDEEGLEFENV